MFGPDLDEVGLKKKSRGGLDFNGQIRRIGQDKGRGREGEASGTHVVIASIRVSSRYLSECRVCGALRRRPPPRAPREVPPR